MQVDRIQSSLGDSLNSTARSVSQPAGTQKSFVEELKSTLNEVNQLQNQADGAISKSATQESGGIHETMIQLEEADISTRLMLKIRSKALDAYNEVMRMQV